MQSKQGWIAWRAASFCRLIVVLQMDHEASGETPDGPTGKMPVLPAQLLRAKKLGFSDRQLAVANGVTGDNSSRVGESLNRHHSHLSPGRYLRGGIRSLHAVLLFDLRRRERAASRAASARS